MLIINEIHAWRNIQKKLQHKNVGFVPTMGNLHAGHMSLCQRSQSENEVTMLSIFVNPMQFNQAQDFENYPRTLQQDIDLLKTHHVDYVFIPEAKEIYPDHYEIEVTEKKLSAELEGEYRPGHFNGMLTVVLKLLNIIHPTRAYFGEKDYQQLLLIKKMVATLFLPLDIVACPTVRAADGLALSSRNNRLHAAQRQHATHFPRLLQNPRLTLQEITQQLQTLGFKVDYIAEKWERRLGAVWLDNVRLIDNF